MKKLLIFVLVLFLVPAAVHAELADLSAMSFEDLLTLRDAVNAEIKSRPEWKEVIVPAGTWTVGVEIPAGSYSITAISRTVRVDVYESKGAAYSSDHLIIHTDEPFGKLDLTDGMVIKIDESAVFAPPIAPAF